MDKNTLEFHSLFYYNPLPSWVYEIDSLKIVDVNEAAIRNYGYSREEFLSFTLTDLSLKEDLHRLYQRHQIIQQQENYISFGMHSYKCKRSGIKKAKVTGYKTVFNNLNCIVAVCETLDNSTKTETTIDQIIVDNKSVLCRIDKFGNFEYLSAAATSQWGYLPQELNGTRLDDLIIKDNEYAKKSFFDSCKNAEHYEIFSSKVKSKEGLALQYHWIIWIDATTEVLHLLGSEAEQNVNTRNQVRYHDLIIKTLIENSTDCLKVLDLDGKIEFINDNGLCQMEIENFTCIKGSECWNFWGTENELVAKDAIEKAKQGESIQFTAVCETAIGTPKCWDVEIRPANKPGEPVVKLISVSRDITEKYNREKITILNEQRYKALVQEASDLIRILDAKGTFLYVSPSSLSILGIEPESFLGANIFDYIHPDDKERALKCLEKINTEKRVVVDPMRFQNHKGEWRWLESVLTNLLDNPAINGIVVNSIDVTEKIEEKHRLKLLESVITHMKDAVLITDAEPFDDPGPRILFVNEAFTKMTGYTSEEVIGKTPRMLQGPKSNKEELARFSKAIRKWEPCEVTTINYTKNGGEFWINFAVHPVANDKGWFTHWIAIERDVTEQKIKELENELLSQIAANFSAANNFVSACHEFCKTIGIFGKFDWIEIWTTNTEKNQMQFYGNYFASPEDENFYECNSVLKGYHLSESIAGKVWSTKTEVLYNTIEKNFDFTREEAAMKIGLKAILGIPLLFGNEVVGVLKVGSKKSAEELTKYINLFKKLEDYIGSEINRKKLEDDLTHLFNVIPDTICLLDFDGRFLKINKAGSDLLGYSEPEILYQSLDRFMHPNDKDQFLKELSSLENERSTSQFENRFINQNGDLIWLSWNCIAVPEEGLIYATAKNSTEENKLRDLNRQVGKLAKIGSWELNLIQESCFWSEEVHQLHETDSKSFEPNLETAIDFYRKDFQEIVKKNLANCISTGQSFDFEAVIVTAKKNEVWVRCIGKSEVVDGVCKRLYGSFQDINSLKATENRLYSLSENLPGVIYQYIIHPDGTDAMDHISGAVEQFWGYTLLEIQGNINLLWDQIKMGGDLEKVQDTIVKSIQTKSKWTCRYRVVMPNGKLKVHLGNGAPIFLADGSIVFNVIVLDVTQEAKIEELLAQASKISRIGSWEMDLINPELGGMYWSPMVKEIVGLDQSYNPTLNMGLEFCIGDYKNRLEQAANSLIQYGKEYDEEVIIRTTKGEERWVRIIGKIEKVNKKLTRIYGSFQDITAAKHIEQEKNSLQAALEKSLNEIFIFDSETLQISYANRGALLNVGYSKNEIVALQVLDIKPDFTASSFKILIAPLLNNEKEKIIYFTNHKRKDGSLYPVEIHLQLVREGDYKRFLAIALDITERKQAEDSLLQSNERFEKVTEATNDVIWDWDLEKQTYYRSKASEKFFGKEASGLFSEKELWASSYIHPDDLEQSKNSFYIAIANLDTKRWQQEYRVYNQFDEIVYVMDQAVIIRNNEGKVSRIVGAMTDISAQKKLTLQLNELNQSLQKHALELERSNEELEQFAFVASHDLQEPLRMISSFMELLERKYGNLLDEKGHQYIHFATDGAKRMKQIILDLLEYSRANKSTDGAEIVDLKVIFSEFFQLRRKIIAEKNAIITHENLPIITTYKAAITQVFHCLLDNAVKYTPEGVAPIITVVTKERETVWEFSITDNGIGIDPQFFQKIFIIFQRLHNKEQYPGTGIGLSIAKRNIEFLGGAIWLDSKPGEGTTFYFTIPKNT